MCYTLRAVTEFWTHRQPRRVTKIGFSCLCFLIGIGSVRLGWHAGWWALFVAIVLFVIAALATRPAIILLICMCGGMLLGMWRGTVVDSQLQTYSTMIGQTVTLRGVVNDDSHYNNKGQRDMLLDHIQLHGRSPPGTVRVTTFSFVQLQRGDVVQVTGKLYDGFGSYQAAIYFGTVTIITASNDVFNTVRHRLVATLYSLLPDTQASLCIGILLGVKTQLPSELSAQLNMLSLTHIVVASGYNLTVLIQLARRLFERRSKFQTMVVGVALMAGFIAITGLSASMGRAVLVTTLSLVAWYYGRRIHPVVLLLVSAAITAACNPLYVWGELGWWLSFLAFSGVLILGPLLHSLRSKKRSKFIGKLVIETIAAELLTVPILLCVFGNISVFGLLANLLIVPLVPIVMLFAAIVGIVGLLTPLAVFAAIPVSWLLSYIMQTMAVLVQAKWAIVTFTIPWQIMVTLYVVIGFGVLLLWRATKHDFLTTNVVE